MSLPPAVAAQLAKMQEDAARRAQAAEDAGQRGFLVCRECGGVGMVETDDTGRGAWRPCSRCGTETWRRWQDGHLEPGHRCAACDPKQEKPTNGRARDYRADRTTEGGRHG